METGTTLGIFGQGISARCGARGGRRGGRIPLPPWVCALKGAAHHRLNEAGEGEPGRPVDGGGDGWVVVVGDCQAMGDAVAGDRLQPLG